MLRDCRVECGLRGDVVRQADGDFGPAGTPRGFRAIPPDPAIAIPELHHGIIGARCGGGGEGESEQSDREYRVFHAELPCCKAKSCGHETRKPFSRFLGCVGLCEPVKGAGKEGKKSRPPDAAGGKSSKRDAGSDYFNQVWHQWCFIAQAPLACAASQVGTLTQRYFQPGSTGAALCSSQARQLLSLNFTTAKSALAGLAAAAARANAPIAITCLFMCHPHIALSSPAGRLAASDRKPASRSPGFAPVMAHRIMLLGFGLIPAFQANPMVLPAGLQRLPATLLPSPARAVLEHHYRVVGARRTRQRERQRRDARGKSQSLHNLSSLVRPHQVPIDGTSNRSKPWRFASSTRQQTRGMSCRRSSSICWRAGRSRPSAHS